MTAYARPSWMVPQAFQATLVPQVRTFASPYGGAGQALDLLGEKWRFELELPPCLRTDAAAREAFLHRLQGGAHTVALHHFGRPYPRGTARGTVTLSSGASAGATSIAVTGVRGGRNLLTHSQAIDDATWNKSNCSVIASTTTDPLGGSTAERIVEDTTASVGRYVAESVSWTAGTTYCISLYLREVTAGAKRYGGILVPSAAAGTNTGVQWDLATGTQTDTAGTVVASGAIAGENSWWRVWCAVTATTTVTAGVQIRFDDAAPGIGGSYTGDGTSGLHIWGVQVEVGSYPTEYGGNGTLLAGDVLGLGSQLLMVAEDFTAAAAGTGTVQLVNRVRVAQSTGAAVTWAMPTAPFALVDAGGIPAAYGPGAAAPRLSLAFEERWS